LDLDRVVKVLKETLSQIHHESDLTNKARLCRTLRLETMINIRTLCDEIENLIPTHLWTLATYKELLFLDQNHKL
jgi:glutamine synthetase